MERFGYAVKILVEYEEATGAQEDTVIQLAQADVENEVPKTEKEIENSEDLELLDSQEEEGNSGDTEYQPSTEKPKKSKTTRASPSQSPPVKQRRRVLGLTKERLEQVEEDIRSFKQLKCPFCDDLMDSFQELLFHGRQVHDTEGFMECCGQKFYQRYRYHGHIMTHINPEAVQCELCPKRFPCTRALRYHRESHIPDEQKLFQCEFCAAKFYREQKLKHHMTYTHVPEDQKPFKCTDCGKRFVNNSLLIRYEILKQRKFAYSSLKFNQSWLVICFKSLINFCFQK